MVAGLKFETLNVKIKLTLTLFTMKLMLRIPWKSVPW